MIKGNEEIVVIVMYIAVISFIIALGISAVIESINDKPLEYTYKNFTERDLTLAMKYHGVDMITITETECFFVNKDHVKVPVFTDGCIEYLYKNKQKEVKK
jgi:hypothetical protein